MGPYSCYYFSTKELHGFTVHARTSFIFTVCAANWLTRMGQYGCTLLVLLKGNENKSSNNKSCGNSGLWYEICFVSISIELELAGNFFETFLLFLSKDQELCWKGASNVWRARSFSGYRARSYLWRCNFNLDSFFKHSDWLKKWAANQKAQIQRCTKMRMKNIL